MQELALCVQRVLHKHATHTHPHTHLDAPSSASKNTFSFDCLPNPDSKHYKAPLSTISGRLVQKGPPTERHSATLNRPRLERLCEKNESIQWNSFHHTANCCPCFYIFISPQFNFWAWGEPVEISTDLSNYYFPLDREH